MNFIQSPEFWSSSAFVLLVLVMLKPASSLLKKWGQKQADQISWRQEEAESVLKKAKEIQVQYKGLYQRRNQERRKIMRQADREIKFLEQDLIKQTNERIARKNQEVDLRLKRIAENGRQDIKRKMLSYVVKQTENRLAEIKDENTDALVEQACSALEKYASVLK